MAIAIFFLLCGLALIFLLYVLANFVATSRSLGARSQRFAREAGSGPVVHVASFPAEKIVAFRQSAAQRQLVRNSPAGDVRHGT